MENAAQSIEQGLPDSLRILRGNQLARPEEFQWGHPDCVCQQSFFRWRKLLSVGDPHRRVSRARGAAFIPVEVVSGDNAEASLDATPRAWLEISRGSITCRVTTEVDEQTLRLIVRVLCEEASGC